MKFKEYLAESLNESNVAKTILQQLGGNKFLAMTGAKKLVSDKNWLRMDLPRNKSKANRLKITLNGKDLYDMEFSSITKNTKKDKLDFDADPFIIKVIKEYKDIYNDQLQELFTQVTGMYTKL